MYQAKELTPEILRGALQQDGLRRVPLVVEPIVQAEGDPPAIALGRYAPTDDPQECEVAITVGDAWQGRGVGRVLLKRLIDLAARGGYLSMSASVLSANAKMIGLARAFGFRITERSNGVTVMQRSLVAGAAAGDAGGAGAVTEPDSGTAPGSGPAAAAAAAGDSIPAEVDHIPG